MVQKTPKLIKSFPAERDQITKTVRILWKKKNQKTSEFYRKKRLTNDVRYQE
jgi:hypothetical protein